MSNPLTPTPLARDVLRYVGDPARPSETLPDPPLANEENIAGRAKANVLARLGAGLISACWEKRKVTFDEEDYLNIAEAYWRDCTPRILALEFTEDQTSRLVARCREEGVTVNTALLAALSAAQLEAQGDAKGYLRRVATAMDIRPHLAQDPGEAFGFYAGGVILDYRFPSDRPFWDAVRELHVTIRKELRPEEVLANIQAIGHLSPTLYDALMFKRYGALVRPGQSRYAKLEAFAKRKDVVSLLVKARRKEKVRVGLVLSNLTRLGFPTRYGHLALERMMFVGPPTYSYQKAVGVVTASGRLALTTSYVEESVGSPTMQVFQSALLGLLARQVGW